MKLVNFKMKRISKKKKGEKGFLNGNKRWWGKERLTVNNTQPQNSGTKAEQFLGNKN